VGDHSPIYQDKDETPQCQRGRGPVNMDPRFRGDDRSCQG